MCRPYFCGSDESLASKLVVIGDAEEMGISFFLEGVGAVCSCRKCGVLCPQVDVDNGGFDSIDGDVVDSRLKLEDSALKPAKAFFDTSLRQQC